MMSFTNLFMPEHTAFIQTGQRNGWPEGYDDSPKPGDEFYLFDVLFTSNMRELQTASKFPGRKNMSGEICIDGWLGETDNVSKTANGQWRIVSAEPAQNAPNYSYWDVTAERIDE